MAGNIFGSHLQLISFGESHGVAMGGVIEGYPAGVEIDLDLVQKELDRRKPGQHDFSSPRKESDRLEILSGVFEGRSLGTPIAFLIRNSDHRSGDYDHLRDLYRTGHADRTYEQKYGLRDHRGGGRASARETVVRVAAAAIISGLMPELRISAYVSAVGPISCQQATAPVQTDIESNALRMVDQTTADQALQYLARLKEAGDSCGGTIHAFIEGIPAGLGEPVYHKLQADLASAMMGINAVKGFELGAGISSAIMPGSEYYGEDEKINSGGIYGGISSGDTIHFKVHFKPISSSVLSNTMSDKEGNKVEGQVGGRHDVCVVPRAVPIVEAMARLVIANHYLMQKTQDL